MIILIVEDEELLAELLLDELTEAGHEVIGPAATEAEALQIAAETTPELALVDINLRDGSRGTMVARRLYKHRKVPSLYMTSAAAEARENRTGALGVVTKPYVIPTVLASIEVAGSLLRGERPAGIPDGLELFH
jgi:two-component system, response regulator PdtaR